MMELTLRYRNGFELVEKINWLAVSNNTLYYTVHSMCHSLAVDVVKIPLENIAAYRVEEV